MCKLVRKSHQNAEVGLTVLAVLESTLPLFCLPCKMQCQETTVTVLAVSAVAAVSVVTAPLNSNPSSAILSKVLSRLCIAVMPRGPREGSQCREAKIAGRQFLPLSCRPMTLTVGVILKEEVKPSLMGGEAIWEAF